MKQRTKKGRIDFCPARREESRTIAELYRISSDDVADYIWSQLAKPGEDMLDVGVRRYKRENSYFSYQNVTFALADEHIAGMIAANPIDSRSTNQLDDKVEPVLAPYMRLEQPDSFYISGMALFAEFRARGIGTQLLDLAVSKASALSLQQLSVVVFEQNVGAVRLYKRHDFRETM